MVPFIEANSFTDKLHVCAVCSLSVSFGQMVIDIFSLFLIVNFMTSMCCVFETVLFKLFNIVIKTAALYWSEKFISYNTI